MIHRDARRLSLVNSSTIVSFAYDHTIYAHWEAIQYIVSFILNDDGDCEIITQDYDSLIFFPEMSRTGYTFVCWCSDPNLTIEYTIKRVEPRNVTLYAKWEANNYTVLFDSKGRDSVNLITVTYGQKYSNLSSSSKKGNVFPWWEMNETKRIVWSNTVVETAHNYTLYTVWKTNVVTLDMSRGGNSDLASVGVTQGKNYENLQMLTRVGYTFAGWFLNETSTEQITNKTNVTISYPHTLYARWRINSYTVSFDTDNGESVDESTLEYNSTVVYPKDPEKRGYAFSRWNNNTLDFMPSKNITIIAQ